MSILPQHTPRSVSQSTLMEWTVVSECGRCVCVVVRRVGIEVQSHIRPPWSSDSSYSAGLTSTLLMLDPHTHLVSWAATHWPSARGCGAFRVWLPAPAVVWIIQSCASLCIRSPTSFCYSGSLQRESPHSDTHTSAVTSLRRVCVGWPRLRTRPLAFPHGWCQA